MKDTLKVLEDLHDECRVIHSGVLCTPFAAVIGLSHYPIDLKPGSILLPYDLDNAVTRELSEKPTPSTTFRRRSWDLTNKLSFTRFHRLPIFSAWKRIPASGFIKSPWILGMVG